MARSVKCEGILPSMLTAYGGSGCNAIAVSSDGLTLAAATHQFINIYPVRSIWLPCISLNVPSGFSENNQKMHMAACSHQDCLYRQKYSPYPKPPSRLARRKYGKRRIVSYGTIQMLTFFGDRNELLVGVGPFLLVIYDLTKMDLNPLIAIDMRYFGVDAQNYPYVMQASFAVLNVYRNYMYNTEPLSCIDFVFSIRPYVPTYYRVLFNEKEKWWFVNCQATSPIIQRDSLDEDVPYALYNHNTGESRHFPLRKNEADAVECPQFDSTASYNNTSGSTTHESTDNDCDEDVRIDSGTVYMDMADNMRYTSDSSDSESDSASEEEESGVTNMGRMPPTLPNPKDSIAMDDDSVSEESETENSDIEDTKSTNSEQTEKDDNLTDPDTVNTEPSAPYWKVEEIKGVYYPFALLEKKVHYTDEQLKSFSADLSDGYLSYKQEFVFTTLVPVSTVVMVTFSVENAFYVRRKSVRYSCLKGTASNILCDLVISNISVKAHSFISRRLGKLFTLILNDRFFVFKYSSPSLESYNLYQYSSNRAQSSDSVSSGSSSSSEGSDKDKMDLDVSKTRYFRVRSVLDDAEYSLNVMFCHYDPVTKLRYSHGCFDTSRGDGYMAVCTTYNSQWGLQIFSMAAQSGVDAMRLVLDSSKCKGFSSLYWIPFSSKLLVISRLNGELYQLEPRTSRSWVGLIPNFSCIDRNLEFIEDEDIFDIVPTAREETPKHEPAEPEKPALHRLVPKSLRSCQYPFYGLGFSLIGSLWFKNKARPSVSQLTPEYHSDNPEMHTLLGNLFSVCKSH